MITTANVSRSDLVLHLACGFYMVNHVTKHMIDYMWHEMSIPQKEEFEIAYGKDNAYDGYCKEIKSSDHAVAFYDGTQLACLMWAHWRDHEGIGRCRTLGCVCSSYAFRHTMSFVRNSKQCRDAFMLTEPASVSEIYVFITDTFTSSRNWAVRVCGLKEFCKAESESGDKFVCYRHRVGED